MTQQTRLVRLDALADRSEARNEGTRVGRSASRPKPPPNARALFNKHQRAVHEELLTRTETGVMVFAFSGAGRAGELWLRASEEVRSGVIGRHSAVDLFLDSDQGFSLRQSVVLVRTAQGVPLIRVVDLESSTGFSIGDQHALNAVDADGAFCMVAGDYVFFVSPTGTPPPWDPDAGDPWATLPKAVIATRQRPERAVHERAPVQAFPGPRREGQTNVARLQGPTSAGAAELLEDGEAPAGLLHLSARDGTEHLEVGGTALDRGVLIGRYSRCGGGAWASTNVSRVHALVIRIDGQVWIVDTGSSNGTWIDGVEVKYALLAPETEAQLSELDGLLVRWQPAG